MFKIHGYMFRKVCQWNSSDRPGLFHPYRKSLLLESLFFPIVIDDLR